MRNVSMIALLALLTACDAASTFSASNTTSITPTRVGDLQIDMPATQVQGLEGTFSPSQVNDECLQMPNKGHSLLLMFQKNSLNRIDITRGNYTTPEGIHLGSTEKDVKAAYSKRVVSQPQKYVAKGHYLNVISPDGTGYVFETNGTTVTRIRVGKTPALKYVEGCA